MRSHEFVDFIRRLFHVDAFQRQHDPHQLVLAAFRQVGNGHVGNQVRRNALVDIDDDEKPIPLHQHMPLLQQVTVENVEGFRRRVLGVVVIAERPGRLGVQVERQAGRFGEHLQHNVPPRLAEVELQMLGPFAFAWGITAEGSDLRLVTFWFGFAWFGFGRVRRCWFFSGLSCLLCQFNRWWP